MEIERIEETYKNREIRKFYQGINAARKDQKKNHCRSKSGQLLMDDQEVLDRWVEYYDELLNKGSDVQQGREEEKTE